MAGAAHYPNQEFVCKACAGTLSMRIIYNTGETIIYSTGETPSYAVDNPPTVTSTIGNFPTPNRVFLQGSPNMAKVCVDSGKPHVYLESRITLP